ncbi:hypothetical protein HYC85_010193 [Camellia sinensis]|uniref:GST N-terminal domain-containing protein n=1 Tax=Camellia sinensis TaxID=4442 RepID=A0A7J7HHS4_CAMSI|nr:hypothetical protein HYC85_010193 [Camellia sinensis]
MLVGASLMDEANRTTVYLDSSHAILRYLACAFPGVVDHCLVLNNVFCSFLKVSDLFKRSKIESVLDWHHSNLRCGAATYVLNTMLAPVLGLQLNPQAAAEGEWSVFARKLSVVRVELNFGELKIVLIAYRFLHQFSLSREQGFMLGHTKAGEFEKSLHVQSHQRLVFLHLLSSLFSVLFFLLCGSPFKEREEQEQEQEQEQEELTSGLTVQNVLKENSIEISEESFFELKYDPESVWGYIKVFSPC